MAAALAGIVFVGLFLAWTVVPSRIRKMHESRKETGKPE